MYAIEMMMTNGLRAKSIHVPSFLPKLCFDTETTLAHSHDADVQLGEVTLLHVVCIDLPTLNDDVL